MIASHCEYGKKTLRKRNTPNMRPHNRYHCRLEPKDERIVTIETVHCIYHWKNNECSKIRKTIMAEHNMKEARLNQLQTKVVKRELHTLK